MVEWPSIVGPLPGETSERQHTGAPTSGREFSGRRQERVRAIIGPNSAERAPGKQTSELLRATSPRAAGMPSINMKQLRAARIPPALGLLALACSLSVAQGVVARELAQVQSGNNELQPQQSLISRASAGGPFARAHVRRERAAPSATATATSSGRDGSELESTTDDISALADSNFLDSLHSSQWRPQEQQQQPQSQTQALAAAGAQADEISEANSIQTLKSAVGKSRRQAEQRIKSADWWTKLAHKHKRLNRDRDRERDRDRDRKLEGARNARPGGTYREQPLSQNELVTIRHQLLAIRDKHRLLLQRSVPQLVQLDQKLVDSYRLCLRKRMPLYAGMLYRTRDFVVRMANEVRNERQVLEAMTKQIQRVLRHRLTNRTLVRDYNRQAAKLGQFNALDLSSLNSVQGEQRQQQHGQPQPTVYELSSSSPSTSSGDSMQSQSGRARRTRRAAAGSMSALLSGPPSASARAHTDSLGKRDYAHSPLTSEQKSASASQPQQQQQRKTRNAQNSSWSPLQRPKPYSKSQQLVPASALDGNDEDQLGSESQGQNSDSDSFDLSTFPIASSSSSSSGSSSTTDTSTSTTTATTRRPRPMSYAVHVNEVNLKRELVKTQALIDRINVSSHELASVADDIIYLFKLTSGELSTRSKGLSASGKISRFDLLAGADQRRMKKVMLKSPLKALLERYGKLTMSKPPGGLHAAASTMSPSATTLIDSSPTRSTMTNEINMMTTSTMLDIDTSDPPEMKPLFDSAEIATYRDPVDLDLGFDAPATLEI